jgi:hypothetical protein
VFGGLPGTVLQVGELSHPMKDGVISPRDAILASDDPITEHIKSNAPSFCCRGDARRGSVVADRHRGVPAAAVSGMM